MAGEAADRPPLPLIVPHEYRLPWLHPYQEKLVTSPAQELVVVSCTQVGKTVACGGWLTAQAWTHPLTLSWWCAPTYKQAKVGYDTMKQLCVSAGLLMPGGRGYSDGDMVLRLLNGSIIECRSWERDENLQGPSVHFIVVDEAGLLTPSARGIISSRRSATLGPIRYIGNPGMTGSEFWLLCQQAIEGKASPDPDERAHWEFMRWTWEDRHASLKAINAPAAEAYRRFIESERRSLPPEEFKRLYDADWATPEGAIFASILDKIAVLAPSDEPHPGHPYVCGWDIGLQSDYTVGLPLCTKCFTITGMVRCRPGSSAHLKEIIRDTCAHWNNAEAVIETNGPGGPILDELCGIYPNTQGWWTDNGSKRSAVFEIIRLANDGGLTIAPFPAMMNELRVFQSTQSPTTGTWSFAAPKGAHDDCAMALVITVGAATSGASSYLRMMERQIEALRQKKQAGEGDRAPA